MLPHLLQDHAPQLFVVHGLTLEVKVEAWGHLGVGGYVNPPTTLLEKERTGEGRK